MTKAADRFLKALAAALLTAAALVGMLCPPAEAAGDFSVKAARGRLSVKATEAEFGPLMEDIARKAGFEVSISPDVALKTLSTDFTDLELEQGIQRLMGLIRHRNFFISSGRDGKIKKIEVFGKSSSAGPSTGPSSPVARPGAPGMTPSVIQPSTEAPAMPQVPQRPSPLAEERILKGAPYIPPATAPEYIPPGRTIGKDRK